MHLADFADDRVHAEALYPARADQHWREWEIELVHGASRLFEAAEETLTATGAVRSKDAAKLARALGQARPPEHVAGVRQRRKQGQAADVATAYLDTRIKELFIHDPGIRLETPDAVHQMRSATRRARSALTTYRQLFDKDTVKKLAGELKWLARILGQARDAEVMSERLRHHLSDLPVSDLAEKDSSGPVPATLERELETAYTTGYRKTPKALDSARYHRLLTDLENFRDHPPTRPRAAKAARPITARLVAKAAKQLQQILGDHQDSVLAHDLLTRFATGPDLPPETSRTCARLLAIEKCMARTTEASCHQERTQYPAEPLMPYPARGREPIIRLRPDCSAPP